MEGPTILVMNHIFNRHMSYQTGVMTCRSNVDGHSLGEKVSTLSISDLEKINDNKPIGPTARKSVQGRLSYHL